MVMSSNKLKMRDEYIPKSRDLDGQNINNV